MILPQVKCLWWEEGEGPGWAHLVHYNSKVWLCSDGWLGQAKVTCGASLKGNEQGVEAGDMSLSWTAFINSQPFLSILRLQWCSYAVACADDDDNIWSVTKSSALIRLDFGWFCSSEWCLCAVILTCRNSQFSSELRRLQPMESRVDSTLETIRLHNESSFGWNELSWWESLTGGKCFCPLPAMRADRVISERKCALATRIT